MHYILFYSILFVYVYITLKRQLKVYLGHAFQNVDVMSMFRLLKDTLSSVNVWRILKDTVDVNSRQRLQTLSRQR